MPSFTAVDFETANSSRASVCAAGVAKVANGEVVAQAHFLVKPPPGYEEFSPHNVRVHGITAADVVDAPPWPVVYREIMRIAAGDVLVGHNVSFDMSVIRNACDVYDLSWPEASTYCTLQMAKRHLPLPRYTLPYVTQALGIADTIAHHDPLVDALAAAQVAVELARRNSHRSLDELAAASPFWSDLTTTAGDAQESQSSTTLAEQAVCFTGELVAMKRADALALVTDRGGEAQKGVTRKTTIVVTGDWDPARLRPGATVSKKLEKAFTLQAAGQEIEVLTEDEFIDLIELSGEELRLSMAAKRAGSARCPEYVIEQARSRVEGDRYWDWFRRALAHPAGRAGADDRCIWCSEAVPGKAHWVYRDRHVCSGGCNEALKRSAKRQWAQHNITGPAAHDDEWGTWTWQGGKLVRHS